ncbi:hypothetical protein GCM10012319_55890 [Comamonas sp. KCTC 72670]|nr:hypothetical protein GCM10012319_55890 [Comamonas sp. KCTC 72670]
MLPGGEPPTLPRNGETPIPRQADDSTWADNTPAARVRANRASLLPGGGVLLAFEQLRGALPHFMTDQERMMSA